MLQEYNIKIKERYYENTYKLDGEKVYLETRQKQLIFQQILIHNLVKTIKKQLRKCVKKIIIKCLKILMFLIKIISLKLLIIHYFLKISIYKYKIIFFILRNKLISNIWYKMENVLIFRPCSKVKKYQINSRIYKIAKKFRNLI